MNTLLLHNDAYGIDTAARILRDGGLVAMPTETVYGLAANALDPHAVKNIFEAKGRPMDNPLIVHIAEIDDLIRMGLVATFPAAAQALADAFWPGPLTMILPKGDAVPTAVSAGLSTVAVRLPSHPVARALIARCGLPLAAPSANTSGRPSPTTATHVIDDLSGRIDAVLDGGRCTVGVESTVITLATDTPRILRPGVITLEQIEAVIGHVEVDPAVLDRLDSDAHAASPGMKYKHYAPRTRVVLVRSDERQFVRFVNRSYRRDDSVAALCYDEDADAILAPTVPLGARADLNVQAQRLFDALRQVDRMEGISTVYARCPRAKGVGMALFNRMIRAAAFEVIDLPARRVIGLTGQTGAGKSEVSRMLGERGYTVVDADRAARIATEDRAVIAALTDAFGDILHPDGTLDRSALARAAFGDEQRRRTLNTITHPKIIGIMLSEARESDSDVVFDAPQLFEAGMEVYCDTVIAVIADETIRRQRISARDRLSNDDITRRMAAQYDEAFFVSRCDKVIENNGTIGELLEKVRDVIEGLNDG